MIAWILGAVGFGGIGLALAFIPGAAKAAVDVLTSLWGWATKNPAAALCGLFLATTVWFWWGKRDADQMADVYKTGWVNEIRMNKAASDANHAAQIAQVKALEAKSEMIAKESDHEHALAVTAARNLTDRYADAHRCTVRNPASVSPASPASQGNDPGVPAQMPADTDMVAVPRTDLQALTEWVAFGVKAHNNGVDKIEAGLAKPAQ